MDIVFTFSTKLSAIHVFHVLMYVCVSEVFRCVAQSQFGAYPYTHAATIASKYISFDRILSLLQLIKNSNCFHF